MSSGGKPPDFVGVGAQRCGTTWWHELVRAHPAVWDHGDKELHFFDELCSRALDENDVRRYHAHFSPPPGVLAGEWTPRYAYDFWTPALLRQVAPDARLLFMVRDPIERYRSGLAVPARRGAPKPTPTMRAHLSTEAANRSRYADQLRHLLRYFPPDRILVLQYERCRADPLGELRRTYRFLGLDDGHTDVDVHTPRGLSSGDAKRRLPPDVKRALVDYLEDDVRALADLAPEVDVSLWPSFSGVAR